MINLFISNQLKRGILLLTIQEMIKKARVGRPPLKKPKKIDKHTKPSDKYQGSDQKTHYKQSLGELQETEDQVSCPKSAKLVQFKSIKQVSNSLYNEQSKNITKEAKQIYKSGLYKMRNIDQLAEELFNQIDEIQPFKLKKQQSFINQLQSKKKNIKNQKASQQQTSVKKERQCFPQFKQTKQIVFNQKSSKQTIAFNYNIQHKIVQAFDISKIPDNIQLHQKQHNPNELLQTVQKNNNQNPRDIQLIQEQISKIKKWKNEAAEARRAFSMATPAYQKLIVENNNFMMPPQCTVIRWDTLMEMYNISQDSISTLFYHMQEGQNPFFSKVFVILRTQLDYAKIYKMRENNLAKMRTFIVRRVLDDFVAQRFQDSPEQLEHLAKHNRRITRFDRNRYQQIGIPQPPSRMKSQYLSTIFSNVQFKQYFLDYIQSLRLQQYLQSSNKKMKTKYQQQIMHIAYKKITVQQKIDLFRKIKRKPLFQSQILQYLDEGRMISVQYCNEKLDEVNLL